MNSNQTVASGYGTECPVCHGTGWELITRAIEGDPAHTFARPCQKCRGRGVHGKIRMFRHSFVKRIYTNLVLALTRKTWRNCGNWHGIFSRSTRNGRTQGRGCIYGAELPEAVKPF